MHWQKTAWTLPSRLGTTKRHIQRRIRAVAPWAGRPQLARREVVCWPRRRASSLVLKVVLTQRTAEALRQTRAQLPHNQRLRPAPLEEAITQDWSGRRRWN